MLGYKKLRRTGGRVLRRFGLLKRRPEKKMSLGMTRVAKATGVPGNYTSEPIQTHHSSTLFFTMHKCASSFVPQILSTAANVGGLEYLYYEAEVHRADFISKQVDADFLDKNAPELFKREGEIYGPLRAPVEVPEIEKYRTIFFLRDPRDALVSAYYSFAFSHVEPKVAWRLEEFRKKREEMREAGIDAYALKAVDQWIIPTFERYMTLHERLDESLFLSYDDYKNDTRAFLAKLFDFIGIEDAEADIDRLTDIAKPVQGQGSSDGTLTHKRSGKSSQFETELKPETIAILNEKLAPHLAYWGFDQRRENA